MTLRPIQKKKPELASKDDKIKALRKEVAGINADPPAPKRHPETVALLQLLKDKLLELDAPDALIALLDEQDVKIFTDYKPTDLYDQQILNNKVMAIYQIATEDLESKPNLSDEAAQQITNIMASKS